MNEWFGKTFHLESAGHPREREQGILRGMSEWGNLSSSGSLRSKLVIPLAFGIALFTAFGTSGVRESV